MSVNPQRMALIINLSLLQHQFIKLNQASHTPSEQEALREEEKNGTHFIDFERLAFGRSVLKLHKNKQILSF
jgi:hypothetical protein